MSLDARIRLHDEKNTPTPELFKTSFTKVKKQKVREIYFLHLFYLQIL